jgi:hypothetical protein
MGGVISARINNYTDVRAASWPIDVHGREVSIASLDHLVAMYALRDDNISKLRSMECLTLADEIHRREAEEK